MIYAERRDEDGELEKGVFWTLSEFAEYRQQGWSSTSEVNQAADKLIEEYV